jgi:hypothetical protein
MVKFPGKIVPLAVWTAITNNEKEGQKVKEAEERVRQATEAMLQMEKIILGGGEGRARQCTRTIKGGGGREFYLTGPMPLLKNAGIRDGLLGLINLYSHLAEAKDDLH